MFGYTYVFNKRLATVRKQIQTSDEHILDRFWAASDWGTEREWNMYFLTKPFPSIGVRLGRATVVLPWLDGPDDIYGELSDTRKVDFLGRPLAWPDGLKMLLDFRN
jgi:hypothetical protein